MTDFQYDFKKYVHLERWVSYWFQVREALLFKPESILVIGKGDGIVIDILKTYVKEIKVLDVDESLNVDIVSSVANIPIPDEIFDIVLCAEVLEHLPFDKFEQCLKEINRISKKGAVISLPHFAPQIKFKLKLPLIDEIAFAPKIICPITHKFNGEHYWEIGKKGYPIKKIKKMIRKIFILKKDFVPFENQYHHFFILEKRMIF